MATVLTLLPRYDYDPTEAAVPWVALKDAGHRVIFATPEGAPAWADRLLAEIGFGWFSPLLMTRPDGLAAYGRMIKDADFLHPIAHQAWADHSFDALLVPGGHAPGVKTLLESAPAKAAVVASFRAALPVGAICHGPVLLARSVDAQTGHSVLHGRRTSALTKLLEWSAYLLTAPFLGRLYRAYPAFVADEVGAALASPEHFERGPLPLGRDTPADHGPGFVVRDGDYVSARWPGDANRFSAALVEAIAAPVGRAAPASG